ncbi:hypothetical protein CR513_25914, partial [Mucuna pruriens]
MAAIGLVVGVHGISCKCPNIVGGIAISSWLNWPTIYSLAAHIFTVCSTQNYHAILLYNN